MADDVLYQGVKGVTDLMVRPGLINLDFADVRSVMDEMGKAMMGTGEAEGEDRSIQAAEKAIANPLLDEISLKGAKGVLINITGGYDLTLFERDEAANRIREEVDPEANIIVGSTLDTEMTGQMRVSVVATGIDASAVQHEVPRPRRQLREPVHSASDIGPAAVEDAPKVHDVIDTPMRAPRHPEPAPQPAMYNEFAPREESVAEERSGSDGLPPPVYQQPAPEPIKLVEPEMEDQEFVAPQKRPAGTPSPEAMARLKAAISKSGPGEEQSRRPAQQQAENERSRFGIGSLIHRMAGHGQEAPVEQPRSAPAPVTRQQPPSLRQRSNTPSNAYEDEPEFDSEQERIEIPAFLRRQAN